MDKKSFDKKLKSLFKEHKKLIKQKNFPLEESNGLYQRYENPILTYKHTPIFWRYDLSHETNPHCMERMGINVVLNSGAIELNGKFYLVARVEGVDRKSFFAIAESDTGIDNFTFWPLPVVIPETSNPDTNIYDMRLTKHEDGNIYGVFCTERKDPKAPKGDYSSAIAQCGLVRTKDLINWERLDDLKTNSPQQRNAVLHPEFINGKYAFYTRPQEAFMEAGNADGLGWGLTNSIEHAVIKEEVIIDNRAYHTITELKNGQGPTPIKTDKGWLHLAHGVRGCAAGLRYVLYVFMTDLEKPWLLTHKPAGYFMAPRGLERVGDVSNVLFANGWIEKDNGDIYIYYASSDTRMHVATTTVEKLTDHTINAPADPGRTYACVQQRIDFINKNLKIMKTLDLE
ncbi:MAG: glycosidase [Planctomycetes bacterium]|nr:glycosidase [Planctomycetota bacterium]